MYLFGVFLYLILVMMLNLRKCLVYLNVIGGFCCWLRGLLSDIKLILYILLVLLLVSIFIIMICLIVYSFIMLKFFFMLVFGLSLNLMMSRLRYLLSVFNLNGVERIIYRLVVIVGGFVMSRFGILSFGVSVWMVFVIWRKILMKYFFNCFLLGRVLVWVSLVCWWCLRWWIVCFDKVIFVSFNLFGLMLFIRL